VSASIPEPQKTAIKLAASVGSTKSGEKLVCFKSGVEFKEGEKPIEWNGHIYHPNHFTCAKCNKEIKNSVVEVDGQPFCDRCGRKAFIKNKLIKSKEGLKGQQPAALRGSVNDAVAEDDEADDEDGTSTKKATVAKTAAPPTVVTTAAEATPVDSDSEPSWKKRLLERKLTLEKNKSQQKMAAQAAVAIVEAQKQQQLTADVSPRASLNSSTGRDSGGSDETTDAGGELDEEKKKQLERKKENFG